MKPRRGPVEQSAKHQLKFLVQELKRPGESVAELYIRALSNLVHQPNPVGYIGADAFVGLSGGEQVCTTITTGLHFANDVALYIAPEPEPEEPLSDGNYL